MGRDKLTPASFATFCSVLIAEEPLHISTRDSNHHKNLSDYHIPLIINLKKVGSRYVRRDILYIFATKDLQIFYDLRNILAGSVIVP